LKNVGNQTILHIIDFNVWTISSLEENHTGLKEPKRVHVMTEFSFLDEMLI